MSTDSTLKLTHSSSETQDEPAKSTEERLQVLEEKFAKRGYDTRPLWEALQKQVNDMQDTIVELQAGIKRLEAQVMYAGTEQSTTRKQVCCFMVKNDETIHRTEATEVQNDFFEFTIYNDSRIVGQFLRADITKWWLE